jgi:hypothetical protein
MKLNPTIQYPSCMIVYYESLFFKSEHGEFSARQMVILHLTSTERVICGTVFSLN